MASGIGLLEREKYFSDQFHVALHVTILAGRIIWHINEIFRTAGASWHMILTRVWSLVNLHIQRGCRDASTLGLVLHSLNNGVGNHFQ